MLRNIAIIIGAASFALACTGPADQPIEPVDGREDLGYGVFNTTIKNGLSELVDIDVPEGTESLLIEVKGDDGLFFMTKFVDPNGRDMVESGNVVTRSAREVPGLVDWMFPNDPSIGVIPGTYQLLIRGENPDGTAVGGEDVEIHVYTTSRKSPDTCGIHLDFLVDRNAVDTAQFEQAVDQIVANVDRIYRQIGVAVIDYSIQQINLGSPDIQLGDRSVLSVVDDVLDQVRQDQTAQLGEARDESIHILLVRQIGGEASGFNPAGYSMGLPGPYRADRPNAAVLVSSSLYVDFDGFLDIDGLSSSLSHEVGHYLGLYHTSEKDGADHDPISDTDQCDEIYTCEQEFERNIMTSAFWLTGPPSKRDTLTAQQGKIVRRHPLCIPMPVSVPEPEKTCERQCEAPTTCALITGAQDCLPACDPFSEDPCNGGSCEADDLGTFVCR